jgi:hypothetical protein
VGLLRSRHGPLYGGKEIGWHLLSFRFLLLLRFPDRDSGNGYKHQLSAHHLEGGGGFKLAFGWDFKPFWYGD